MLFAVGCYVLCVIVCCCLLSVDVVVCCSLFVVCWLVLFVVCRWLGAIAGLRCSLCVACRWLTVVARCLTSFVDGAARCCW